MALLQGLGEWDLGRGRVASFELNLGVDLERESLSSAAGRIRPPRLGVTVVRHQSEVDSRAARCSLFPVLALVASAKQVRARVG